MQLLGKVKKIFSDKKRTLAISNAEEDKNNVIIMDDGLQNYHLEPNNQNMVLL